MSRDMKVRDNNNVHPDILALGGWSLIWMKNQNKTHLDYNKTGEEVSSANFTKIKKREFSFNLIN